MQNGMECGMECGMEYGTQLAYHKHANYVAMPIIYLPTTCTRGSYVLKVILLFWQWLLHVHVQTYPHSNSIQFTNIDVRVILITFFC